MTRSDFLELTLLSFASSARVLDRAPKRDGLPNRSRPGQGGPFIGPDYSCRADGLVISESCVSMAGSDRARAHTETSSPSLLRSSRTTGYYNPVLSYGEELAVQHAREAGANGFIVVDLPPEEAVRFREVCTKEGSVRLSFGRIVSCTVDAQTLTDFGSSSTDCRTSL